MNMTLAIPVMNQLNDAKPALGLFRYNTSPETEWMIIDNGSTDPYEDFVYKHLKPERILYLRNDKNIGMVKTLQQAYENCDTDILAISHNDVFIYEKDWDQRVIQQFKEDKELGGIGFFGSQGCGPIGERIQDVPSQNIAAGMSNMLEGSVHGLLLTGGLKPPFRSAAIFDGFFMAFRMEMLKKAGGFDQRYKYHHLYDRDASLESIRHGYKNIVLGVPCHHMSGLTANRTEYQTWVDEKTGNKDFTGDKWTHDENTEIFKEKWKNVLPIYVEDDFRFRSGERPPWKYRSDLIKYMPKGQA